MPNLRAPALSISSLQRQVLEKIIRRFKSNQQHVFRAKIILCAADGLGNQQIAEQLNTTRLTVRTWRNRWSEKAEALLAVESEEGEKALYQKTLDVLSDAPRSGAPIIYSAEVVCQVIAVACEPPQECGHPISHWTPAALRLEVIKRGIVEDISVRQIGRFLKRGRFETPSGALLGKPATPR
jgi:putative transposase